MSNQRFTRDDVDIRPATEADRPAITRIASQTWDGRDYLPRVLDAWLQDDDGAFSVMTYQGDVVALAKLTKYSEDEWWMEGLRVDPAVRGRNLARIMHHYVVAQARQLATGTLRFATGLSNEPILKLAAETGFQRTCEFVSLWGAPQPDEPVTWWPLDTGDQSRVRAWLDASDYFHDVDTSFEHRWTWRFVNEQHLHERLQAGQVYGWNLDGEPDGDLLGVLVANPLRYDTPDERPRLTYAFADARPDWRPQFWRSALGLAATLGGQVAHIKVVHQSRHTEPLIEAGWEASDSHPVLFSRPVVLTEQSEVRFEEIPALE